MKPTCGALACIALALLTALAPLGVAAQENSTSDVVVVRPGKLHRFAVTNPADAAAGETIEVVLEALDAATGNQARAAQHNLHTRPRNP